MCNVAACFGQYLANAESTPGTCTLNPSTLDIRYENINF